MRRSKDEIQLEFETTLEAMPTSEVDRQKAAAGIARIRDEALQLGCRELAVCCLKALSALLPWEQWLTLYADALIKEEPAAMSYISRATALRCLGRCRDSMADYLMALQLEGPDGNTETLKIAVAGIGALLGLTLKEANEGS